MTALTAAVVNGPDHGTLALNGNGSFTYTPEANYNGTDSFTYRANDGTLNSNLATVTINISAVNDAPSFNLPTTPNQIVNEDAGAQTVNGFATNISKGPANENGQVVSFAVTNDQNALFSDQPQISPSGTLTYTPAANASGAASVTVRATDNGGKANGGDDESAPQSFTITVNAVNDLPTVTLNGPTGVSEGDVATFTYTFADLDSSGFTLKSSNPDCGTGGELNGAPVTTPVGGSFKCRFTDGPEGTTVRVQVSDSEGGDSNTATHNLTVADVGPTVTLSGPSKVKKGQTATYTFTTTDPGSDTFAFVAGYPSCGRGAKPAGIPTIGAGSFQCKFVRAPSKPTVVLRVQDSDGTPSNVASMKVRVK